MRSWASHPPVRQMSPSQSALTCATASRWPKRLRGLRVSRSQSRRLCSAAPTPTSMRWPSQSMAMDMMPPGCPSTLCRQVQSLRSQTLNCSSPPLAARRCLQLASTAQTPPGCAATLFRVSPVVKLQSRSFPSPQPPSAFMSFQSATTAAQPSSTSVKVRWQPPRFRLHSLTLSSAPLTACMSSQSTASDLMLPPWPSRMRTQV
mmetsp:Transcript_26027/g.77748  ORF Transcript_26027/g.77748 Transcript_26027/m.77748 type:complete len:204 (-) Transcript_26027:669-1280(-)